MHISKLELENIKSHISSTFEFTRGTTAITGENGAGKTTIIEAIAWALFDLLEYKKEDFVRRGSKKGVVRVTFESGIDGRAYVVYRDTGAGYNVTDPRLQTRIADKKDEVFRFLWQHLGLEPGTDLRSLFRQAIGVPQGTFTAIFLEGTTERKVAFDRLLKVEEYRQAAEKLRDTSKYIDGELSIVRESIARAEGELSRAELIENEHNTYAGQVRSSAAELATLNAEIANRQKLVDDLNVKGALFADLKLRSDQIRAETEKQALVIDQHQQAVRSATLASERLSEVREGAAAHLAALERLTELERERVKRDQIRGELARVEKAIVTVAAEQKRFADDLQMAGNARHEIEKLRPSITEQERLEKEIGNLQKVTAEAAAAASQIANIDAKLERLRTSYRSNQAQLKDAEEKAALAVELVALESRTGELMQSLATLQANLERDERFQSEIRNGLCPVLSQKCLNLAEGQTLESFVSSQFTGLRSQIGLLESEKGAVTEKLAVAREAAKAAAALETFRQRGGELAAEGKSLADERSALEKLLDQASAANEHLAAASQSLAELDDPRGRTLLLERAARREAEYRSGLSDTESNMARLQREQSTLVEQLEAYRDLDAGWSKASAERDATLDVYRIFLANEAEAKTLVERQEQLETATALGARARQDMIDIETALAAAAASYDMEEHNAELASLRESEKRHATMQAILDAAKQREQQLAADLARFVEIRRSLQTELTEKVRLETVSETTAFIRGTLKDAAPRVARNYVYHVSLEANQMFREITGNAERTLKWAEDYSIVLEEDGFERPFVSLSGGEQMAAALSIRLALLKQLSDVRLAFFDEPTTNLDAERRENFAQQISRITHFDQLFVISHDDTFDHYVDHVIAIGHQI